MKKLSTLFLVIASFLNMNAQAPVWDWAKNATGTGDDGATSVKTDANGNILVVGYFKSPSIIFGSTTLYNAGVGTKDMFFAKYDANGNVLWAKSSGGADLDITTSVTTDAGGNIYIAGFFYSISISFDSITLNNSANGFSDMFLVKYDPNGNVLWAKSTGGINDDQANSVSIDALGNLLVTGNFCATCIFDTISLTSFGSFDIFLAKYNSNGNVIWAKTASSSLTDDNSYSVVSDAAGNIIITGRYGGPIVFDSITLPQLSTYGTMFLAKYNSNGNVLWAKSTGAWLSAVNSRSLVTDSSENIFVAGDFLTGSIIFGTDTLQDSGGGDVLLVKYDNNGNVLWAKRAGGPNGDYAKSIAIDISGNVFIGGFFASPSITFGSEVLTHGTGGAKIFLTKYDNNGNVVWAKSTVGDLGGNIYAISSDVSENITVAGSFWGDSTIFDASTLTSGGGIDMFMAKLNGTCNARFILYPDTTIAHNWFALNQANGIPPLTYIWSWGDGTTSTGATPSHTYTTPAYYNICLNITDASGCSNTYCDSSTYIYKTEQTMITVNCVSQLPNLISESAILTPQFTISPNPATNTITITIDETMLGGTATIYDITGKNMTASVLSMVNSQWSMDNYSTGVYIVEIKSKAGSVTKRLVKM